MFVIYGPPGTGKTTTLLDMVEKSIEKGTPPGQIAFLAFTRKAAREARERAASRFNLDTEHDLYFFAPCTASVTICSTSNETSFWHQNIWFS